MAIIFGGASGLGEATAKAFANEDAKVVVTGRDEEDGRRWQSNRQRHYR
ncbi:MULTISPECIES: SDR family NAD(P)-dependent oxidoreductase [Psychrobacter]|nr:MULTISPECIES: SDR family NAD(P)-dependent oxidoreductase [Psychrobacter]MEC9443781.1 SDR family NAD(P)-dependent oxidoreductase [Pseudomonadota bacterium]MED6318096.1 SDR family NAD(P)-dependent oxidoreductase [Pseudomonadota bacterium]